jgi:hypothetical protein
MKIALYYDETFRAYPEFWLSFVSLARQFGHEVRIVTYRNGKFAPIEDPRALEIGVIYTDGRQKINFYPADVWIDDCPETIPNAESLGTMYDGCLMRNDMK